MGFTQLTPAELEAASVGALGLDPDVLDLDAPEVLAEILRRAASVRCPCRRQTLLRAMRQTVRGTAHDSDDAAARADAMLEALLAYGDLLELPRSEDTDSQDDIHLAPIAFTRRPSGLLLIMGIAPDNPLPLPEEWSARIERRAHVRRIPPQFVNEALPALRAAGFVELPARTWERSPDVTSAADVVAMYTDMLQRSGPSGTVGELSLLDPGARATYYAGRWTVVRRQTGTFVATRARTYGRRQWCFVQLREGEPEHFLAFPTAAIYGTGADEAWRLQMAIDDVNGTPQRYRIVQSRSPETVVLQFFSPVPKWAQRRWDSLGERLVDRRVCLFSYAIPRQELAEERRFLTTQLWLSENEGGQP